MSPAAEIIERLGGATKIASSLGCKRSAVTMWPKNGVPYRHWPALQDAGITLDALKATRPEAQTGQAA